MGWMACSWMDDALEVRALPGVGDDVLDFQRGVGRQDDVGEEAVVLQPGVLRDDALDLGSLEGLDGPVAVVPAGDAAGRVGPHHVDLGAALFLGDRIGVLDELVFGLRIPGRRCRRTSSGGLRMASWMRVLGMSCLPQASMVVRQGIRKALAQIRVEEADALEAFGPRHAEVGHLALMDAGSAQALHAQQDAFQPAGLVRVRAADHASRRSSG